MIRRPLTAKAAKQIAEMYRAGAYRTEICAAVNVSMRTVNRVIRSQKIKRKALLIKPALAHRCPICGSTVLTNICVKCEIEKQPGRAKGKSSNKRKLNVPVILGVDLSGDEYARYLDVRNRIGLPQLVCTE